MVGVPNNVALGQVGAWVVVQMLRAVLLGGSAWDIAQQRRPGWWGCPRASRLAAVVVFVVSDVHDCLIDRNSTPSFALARNYATMEL